MFLAVAPFPLWLSLTGELSVSQGLFVVLLIAAPAVMSAGVLIRTVTRIEVNESGECSFRAPLRVVAVCGLADVSEIGMPVHGRTLKLRASGRRVSVLLPMDGISAFLSRVEAAGRRADEPAEPTGEPLACQTEPAAVRFQRTVWVVVLAVGALVILSWLRNDPSTIVELFAAGWVGFAAWIGLMTFTRTVTHIDVDEGGICTFRTHSRVRATCSLAEVSEIKLAGNGRTLSLRASGSKVLVTLPMDGITAFVSRVRAANPGVAVNGF